MVDQSPAAEPFPRPRQKTLALLVGRITTIKLAYWAALTIIEIALPRILDRDFAGRFPFSLALAAVTSFVAASVVASPASLPLLLIERARSLEGCSPGVTCHFEAIWLWVGLFAVGFVLIPAVFAFALPRATRVA